MATGKEILATATREIGTTEHPAGSNKVKYNAWYYGKDVSGSAYPWCMAFVQWVFNEAGSPLPFKTASCGGLLRWYQRNMPECVSKDPVPGCIVIFDIPETKSRTDHTGIFENRTGDYVTTIDGNTGTTSEANGGAVMRRTRPASMVMAYIIPRELEEEKTEDEDMEKRYETIEEIRRAAPWAVETVEKLIADKLLQGNGEGLDLSNDMLRLLVINDRAGLYDKEGD